MILYDYFRSSAAYRVRIVLNLKDVTVEHRSVNLVEGVQRTAEYLKTNPQGLVPSLVLDDGTVLTQSVAICEYLDEVYPEPALLGDAGDSRHRARIRAMVNLVAADIHPVNNLRILNYLGTRFGADQEAKNTWYRHWIHQGFDALENLLDADYAYCCGASLSLADVCLVPQVFNARRFECELDNYPKLVSVSERCEALPAFARAHPMQQPGAS